MKKDDGTELSTVVTDALIADGNGAVKQNIGTKKTAIGYLSLGAVDDMVKAVDIEGVEATEANVQAGKYGIKRPFLLVTQGAPSETAVKFLEFITGAEGQKIVADEGYITIN